MAEVKAVGSYPLTYLICFFFLNFYLFIFISGCIGSLLLCSGFLQLRQVGTTLHCGAWASHCGGFSCCGALPLSVRASVVVAHELSSHGSQAQQLWHTGLVVPWHVGSSWTRAQTHVPCISRRILNHCTTREAHFI